MKKIIILFVFLNIITYLAFAQCGGGTILTVQNPSFEGTPGTPHVTPPLWDICQPGVTPDTQPGAWGVTLPPSDGISYVAFCNQNSPPWHEGASQTLSSPMVAGTTYNFTIDLATTSSTGGGITPGCIEMQIWGNMGGNSGCDMTELLWSSGDVYDIAHIDHWVTHNVTFTPTQNWGHILFQSVNLGCTSVPYIMLDNLSPISPMVDVPDFAFNNVCVGDSVNFTDNSIANSGTLTSWLWDFGDGTPTSALQNPAHMYTSPGTYTVNLTIYTSYPCSSNVSQTVVVSQIPTSTFTTVSPVCNGGNTTITYNGNASPSATYTWGFDGGTIVSGTGQGPFTINWPTAGTHYITLNVSESGCPSTQTIIPVVYSNLTTSSTVVNDVSCYGLSDGNGNITSTNGIPVYTYNWTPSVSTSDVGANLPAGNYSITVTDSAGCTSTTNFTITQPDSISNILTPQDEHCSYSCDGQISTNVSGGTPTYTYLWSNGEATPTITNLCDGNYTVTVTDDHNCPHISNQSVGTSTTLNASANADAIWGVVPFNVNFNYNGSLVSNYLWNFGDGTATSNIQNPSHVYTNPGVYTVDLIVNTGDPDYCTDTIKLYITVEEPSSLVIPNVFTPNGDGFNDVFTVQSKGMEVIQGTIFNRWGKLIGKWDGITNGWDGKNINDGKLSADGVYFYILYAKGKDNIEYNKNGTVTLIK